VVGSLGQLITHSACVGDLSGVGLVHDVFRSRDPHLVGLADVPHVDRALELVLSRGEPLLAEGLARPVGGDVQDRLHRAVVERGLLDDVGLDVVVLDVDAVWSRPRQRLPTSALTFGRT